jgi:hypothetical protein
MKRRIAAIIAAVAGVGLVATAVFIGAGVLDSRALLETASTPAPQTTIASALSEETPTEPVVSSLPAEMIAGLPGYDDEHDRDTYIRVQTWIKICMTAQYGHSYQFALAPESGTVLGLVSTRFIPMPEGFDQHEQNSLYGTPGNLLPDYDWKTGGCYGEAVHKAGLLDDDSSGFTDSELAEITELYNSMAYPPPPPYGYAGETPGFASGFDAVTGEAIDASITSCMNEHGFDFDITDNVRPDGTVQFSEGAFGVNPISKNYYESQTDDAFIVLYGPHLSADQPYDWQTGGCYGAAIHEAGVPGAE